ncbi:ribonuclease P protein component [Paraburkholderia hayleyella]|uniref:ribonuclease P protein component n=1 Tax=Paraburkholderia hayleyella TaxID=2152889 RepID=UPI0012927894|nr:ribonuclease P protein component [Paraburkholderia hayleyella]
MTEAAGALPLDPDSAQTRASFPKAARLLKTDEFSSVFRLRPWRRTAHFVVYARPTGNAARLGLVTGKKYAPRAVTRNLVRRIAREHFRLRRADFDGWDVLLRVHTRFDKKASPSASSPPLKALCCNEIDALLDKVAREIVRRRAEAPLHASSGKPDAAAN